MYTSFEKKVHHKLPVNIMNGSPPCWHCPLRRHPPRGLDSSSSSCSSAAVHGRSQPPSCSSSSPSCCPHCPRTTSMTSRARPWRSPRASWDPPPRAQPNRVAAGCPARTPASSRSCGWEVVWYRRAPRPSPSFASCQIGWRVADDE